MSSEAKRKASVDAAKELVDLYPGPCEVVVRVNTAKEGEPANYSEQETVRIEEMDITQCARMTLLVREIREVVDIDSANSLPDLVFMAAEHHEILLSAVSIATGVPRERVAHFAGSQFIAVVMQIFETNRDFFSRNLARHVSAVMAMFTTMMASGEPKANGAGSTHSPSFESTAESSTPNVSH